jgi:hypothetical protein
MRAVLDAKLGLFSNKIGKGKTLTLTLWHTVVKR